MDTYPKRVMVFDYQPGKTLLMGTVELRDVVGALSKVSAVLAKHGVDLTMSSSHSASGREKAVWTFVGIAKPGTDVGALEKAVRASPAVLNCEVRVSDRGLLSDRLNFPLWIGENQRGIVISPLALTSMFSHIKKLLGTGGATLLYEQGRAVGRLGATNIAKVLPKARLLVLDPEISGIYAAVGWGQLEVTEKNEDLSNVTVSVKGNFEAEGVRSKGPNCHFMRGILEGYYSTLLGKEMACVETKCIAAGAPACKFNLS